MLMQVPLHSSWPEEQVGPAEGLAQPAMNSAEPRAATQAKKEIVRETILGLLMGDRSCRTMKPSGRPALPPGRAARALYTAGPGSGKGKLPSPAIPPVRKVLGIATLRGVV